MVPLLFVVSTTHSALIFDFGLPQNIRSQSTVSDLIGATRAIPPNCKLNKGDVCGNRTKYSGMRGICLILLLIRKFDSSDSRITQKYVTMKGRYYAIVQLKFGSCVRSKSEKRSRGTPKL